MNNLIEQLHRDVALGIYAIRPANKWTKGIFTFQSITCMSDSSCTYFLDSGIQESVMPNSEISNNFIQLRKEMANINENKQAWYTATCGLTSDGKFKFDFDYDHLPAFEIIPSPDKWLDEFKTYPRPELQAQIQDWIDGKVEPREIVQRLIKLQQD